MTKSVLARWAMLVLGGFATFVAAALIYVLTLDLSRYRTEIQQAVKVRTGGDLTISGDLSLAWADGVTLVARGLSFHNPAWVGDEPIATLGELDVTARIWPLLSGEFHITNLRVLDLEIHLKRDENGLGNWVGLRSNEAPDQSDSKPDPFRGDLHDVRIEGLSVNWQPDPNGKTQTVVADLLTLHLPEGAERLKVGVSGQVLGRPYAISGLVPPVFGLHASASGLPFEISGTVGGEPVLLAGGVAFHSGSGQEMENRIQIAGLEWGLGPLNGAGGLEVELRPARPFLSGHMEFGSIDLSELAKFATGPGDPKNRTIPLNELAALDGRMSVTIASIRKDDFVVERFAGELALSNGVLELNDVSAKIEGGVLQATAWVDGNGPRPLLRLDARLVNTDVGRLMTALTGEDRMQGRADLLANLSSTGASAGQLIAELEGRVGAIVHKGMIDNTYWEMIAEDLATKFVPFINRGPRGLLNCAVASFDIKGGVATSRVILIDSDRVQVAGRGEVDLAERQVEIRLVPQPKDPSLVSLSTPLEIKGDLADPMVHTDHVAVAADVGTAVAAGLVAPPAVLLPFLDRGTWSDACPTAILVARGLREPTMSGDRLGFSSVLEVMIHWVLGFF